MKEQNKGDFVYIPIPLVAALGVEKGIERQSYLCRFS